MSPFCIRNVHNYVTKVCIALCDTGLVHCGICATGLLESVIVKPTRRERHIIFAWSAPSHYLNQCWNIVNWTLWNKDPWNLNRKSNIFIQENAFQNVVWKMAAILSRPQCVNATRASIWWPPEPQTDDAMEDAIYSINFLKVGLLALGQLYGGPSITDAILNDMGSIT